jgi:hypothetical protein
MQPSWEVIPTTRFTSSEVMTETSFPVNHFSSPLVRRQLSVTHFPPFRLHGTPIVSDACNPHMQMQWHGPSLGQRMGLKGAQGRVLWCTEARCSFMEEARVLWPDKTFQIIFTLSTYTLWNGRIAARCFRRGKRSYREGTTLQSPLDGTCTCSVALMATRTLGTFTLMTWVRLCRRNAALRC